MATPAATAPALEWSAPPGCPDREQVLAHVGALVRDDVVEWDRFERVRGQVSSRAELWVLELEFVRSGGVSRRRLESARCADLAQAAAVAIVLAHRLGESAGGEWDADTASEPATSPTPAPAPAQLAADDRDSRPEASADAPPLVIAFEARALLDPTTLGTAALGVELGAGLELGPWSAGLQGVLFPAVETGVGPGQAIELGAVIVGARGCRRWAPGFGTCLGMEAGQVRASAVGLEQPSSARDLWLAPSAGLELSSQPFEALAITAGAAVLVPLVRGEFRVDEAEVHRIPPLAVRLGLGLRVRIFP